MLEHPERYQQVRIVWRKDHSDDLWSIRLVPEQPLLFKPGQYATLGVEHEDKVIERAYSIVSSPLEAPEIEFFFELVPQGALTPKLYPLGVGDTMLMRKQPKGLFTLDAKTGHKKHFLVSTVTGVAPYVAMARTLSRQSNEGAVPDQLLVALQAASYPREFAYREELEETAAAHPGWLKYVPTISRPWETPDWKGESGRAEDLIREYMKVFDLNPAETTGYLCGHPQMIENGKGILKRAGFTKESIKEEVYWIPAKGAED
jgi:ferredoxin--NADP+ reductase